MTHYIAMAGLYGCLPNVCESHDSRKSAVESMAVLHDLTPTFKRALSKFGYVDLVMDEHGNEYAEVTECDCEDASIHDDNS